MPPRPGRRRAPEGRRSGRRQPPAAAGCRDRAGSLRCAAGRGRRRRRRWRHRSRCRRSRITGPGGSCSAACCDHARVGLQHVEAVAAGEACDRRHQPELAQEDERGRVGLLGADGHAVPRGGERRQRLGHAGVEGGAGDRIERRRARGSGRRAGRAPRRERRRCGAGGRRPARRRLSRRSRRRSRARPAGGRARQGARCRWPRASGWSRSVCRRGRRSAAPCVRPAGRLTALRAGCSGVTRPST